MKRLVASTLLIAGAAFVSAAAAQQPPPPPPADPPSPPPVAEPPAAAQVSQDELETFATIYSDLQAKADQYQSEISGAETTQEAQQAQERMRQESLQTIEEHGWTLDKYNAVAQAINSDPELVQEVLALIQEDS